MRTKIRDLRKKQGLTLGQVAISVGTTPQTIQRLETGNMSISLDWLERIAAVLNTHPADLIDFRNDRQIPFLGELGPEAGLKPEMQPQDNDPIAIDIPARDPIAVKLSARFNSYEAGSILIADRLNGDALEAALDRDCLVALSRSGIVLRRVVRGAEGTITLVSLKVSTRTQHNVRPAWIAPIVMAVRFI